MTNLGDFLDKATQEAVDQDAITKHGPLWSRKELDHETDPQRWRLATKQTRNVHRLYRCKAITIKGKPCKNGQHNGPYCKEHNAA